MSLISENKIQLTMTYLANLMLGNSLNKFIMWYVKLIANGVVNRIFKLNMIEV